MLIRYKLYCCNETQWKSLFRVSIFSAVTTQRLESASTQSSITARRAWIANVSGHTQSLRGRGSEREAQYRLAARVSIRTTHSTYFRRLYVHATYTPLSLSLSLYLCVFLYLSSSLFLSFSPFLYHSIFLNVFSPEQDPSIRIRGEKKRCFYQCI